MNAKNFIKENIFTLTMLTVTAILITVTGIIFKLNFLNIIPLYVSLFVALLQTRVNRYASLLGGLNSILYAVVYFSFKLYASAAYAILMSFPLQIVTFINWSRHPKGNSTVLKRLTFKQRAVISVGSVAFWLALYFILSLTNAGNIVLDNTVTMLGILASVLMMLAYIEYAPLMLVGNICSLVLYITMIFESPEQLTYLIYSLYGTVCCILTNIRTFRGYKEQKNI